jgi:hypothetical protein
MREPIQRQPEDLVGYGDGMTLPGGKHSGRDPEQGRMYWVPKEPELLPPLTDWQGRDMRRPGGYALRRTGLEA